MKTIIYTALIKGFHKTLLFTLLFTAISIHVNAQWRFSGQVLDGDFQPIPGIKAEITELELSTNTNPDGTFMFTGLFPNEYMLKIYFEDGSEMFRIVQKDFYRVNEQEPRTVFFTKDGAYGLPVNAVICQGDSFSFGGRTYKEAGIFRLDKTIAYGRDSVLYLTVLPSYMLTYEKEITSEESYVFHERTLSEAGTYSVKFKTSEGCDSIIIVNLNVIPVYRTTLEKKICPGDTLIFPVTQRYYTRKGVYVDTLKSFNGFDSIITLNLKVKPTCTRISFLIPSVTYGNSLNAFGLRYGKVKTAGWYLQVRSNFALSGLLAQESCDENGYVNELLPEYKSDVASRVRFGLDAGTLFRLHIPVYLYLGAGYEYDKLFWQTTNDVWIKNRDHSRSGMVTHFGLMLQIRPLIMYFGLRTHELSTRIDQMNIRSEFGLGLVF